VGVCVCVCAEESKKSMQWDNKHKSTPETQVLVLEYAKSI